MKLNELKNEIDGWIKDLQSQISKFDIKYIKDELYDVGENADHNYELLRDLRCEIKILKEEMSAIRSVHLIHLKGHIFRDKITQKNEQLTRNKK